MSWGKKIAAAAGIVGVGAVVAIAPLRTDGQKDLFHRVEIDAEIEPDGDLELVERRTYEFAEPFSSAEYTIDHGPPDRVVQFWVRESGTEIPHTAVVEDGAFRASWPVQAREGRRTFLIHYQIRCAVDVFADAAHLRWRFLRRGWEEPTRHVRLILRLPEVATVPVPRDTERCPPKELDPPLTTRPLRAGEIQAWIDGPESGSVRILDPHTIEFTASDVPPGTFAEASIVLPPEAVPIAFQHPRPGRERILAEGRARSEG